MPEMTFSVRWPDGAVAGYYSPSLVVHEHLQAGRSYTVADFSARAAAALDEAGDRVRARFGFACSASAASASAVRSAASAYDGEAVVHVVAMEPPLPAAQERP